MRKCAERRHSLRFHAGFCVAISADGLVDSFPSGLVTIFGHIQITIDYRVDFELPFGQEIGQIGEILLAQLAGIAVSRIFQRRDHFRVRGALQVRESADAGFLLTRCISTVLAH